MTSLDEATRDRMSDAWQRMWLTRLAIVPLMGAATTATWGAVRLGPVPLSDGLLAVALALVLFDVLTGINTVKLPSYVYVAATAVGAVAAINFLSPANPQYLANRLQLTGFAGRALSEVDTSAFSKALYWIVALLVVPFVTVACTNGSRMTIERVLTAVVVGTSVSGGVAISDFFGVTKVGLQLNGYVNESTRQFGLTVHSNNLGVSCAIAMPIAVYLMGRGGRSWVGAACVPLLLGGVVLSGSRGAQVALVLALAIAAIVAARRAPFRIFLWAGALAFLALAVWSVLGRYIPSDATAQLLRFGDDAAGSSSSDDGRATLAAQAVNDFWHSPLVGIGIPYITYAHSIYLQLLSAGGLLLTAPILYYFGRLLQDGFASGRTSQPAKFITISLMTWLVVGIVENQLTDRFLYYTGACLIALVYSVPRIKTV